jgi:hypothetical protein
MERERRPHHQLGEQGQKIDELDQKMDELGREMREGFALQATGMAQITALLTTITVTRSNHCPRACLRRPSRSSGSLD